jgi:hypothetical protein
MSSVLRSRRDAPYLRAQQTATKIRSPFGLGCQLMLTCMGSARVFPPSLRYGAAMSLRARRSSKSEGGMATSSRS